MGDLQVLDAVEAALASQRGFGDLDYIRDQMLSVFKQRLGRLGQLPAAVELLDALNASDIETARTVMSDMVLRCAIQHALWRIELSWQRGLELDRCSELFREAAVLLERGCTRGPLEVGAVGLNHLGLSYDRGRVWNDDQSNDDDLFLKTFRDLIRQNYRADLCSPNTDELAGLRRGAQLLNELLPQLTYSALSHTQIIGIFPQEGQWKGCGSSSQFRLTGTLFLDRHSLGDPWWVAEHLLHEALHQKLYDFRHGHSLFERRSHAHEAQTICSPWNSFGGGANRWDAFRAFAAFHVYVHLALFGAKVEQRLAELPGGPLTTKAISSRKAIDRARYLGYCLGTTGWDELGIGGKRFHEWLMSVLDVLDPAPSHEGAYVHLLLDLYRNEAKKVMTANDGHRAELSALLSEEVDATRLLLSGLGVAKVQVDGFKSVSEGLLASSTSSGGETFYRVRDHVATAILNVCRDGQHIDPVPGFAKPNETVWTMVRQSSERLSALMAEPN